MSQTGQDHPRAGSGVPRGSGAPRGGGAPAGPVSRATGPEDLRRLGDTGSMERPVQAVAASWPPGAHLPSHRHTAAQLVHAVSGVMAVTTRDGLWVVPPGRGLWVPPLTPHAIRMRGRVAMRTLYAVPGFVPHAPRSCAVLEVSPLLREILLRALDFPVPYPTGGAEERLVAVVPDEIRAASRQPVHLPMPADPRALRVAEALRHRPEDDRPLEAWAREAGASARTLARLFRRDTDTSFGAWRQQARLLRSLELLAEDRPVTAVALDLGYQSPSAFVSMFRRALGVTPGRYFRGG